MRHAAAYWRWGPWNGQAQNCSWSNGDSTSTNEDGADERMVTVLAQVLGRLVKTLAYLVFALLRRPGLIGPLLVAVVVAVQVARWGWVARSSVLVVVLAGGLVWRFKHRSSFNRLVW